MWEEGKFNVCLKGQGKNLHNIEGKKPVQIHVHVEKKKRQLISLMFSDTSPLNVTYWQ